MEENESSKKPKVDFSDLTEINNLDTARMALRWALERMHALDKLKDELAQQTQREAGLREKAEEEVRALQRSLVIHAAEVHQREAYYKKMEELIALRIAGNLDAAALAQREVEAAQLKDFCQRRQAELEKEYALKQEALERDYQRLRAQSQGETEEQAKGQEAGFAKLRSSLENDYAKKFAALRETEFQLKQREREVAERAADLKELNDTQRLEINRESRRFQELLETQLESRLQNAEKLMHERQGILERNWAQERAMLLSELAQWEKKWQEQQLDLRSLEKRLAEAHAATHQAQLAPERQQAQFAAEKSVWEQEKRALAEQVAAWEKKYHEQLPRLFDLENRVNVAEESARRGAERLERESDERRRAEDRCSGLEAEARRVEQLFLRKEQEFLAREHEEVKEQFARIRDLERRLAEAHEAAQQAQAIPQRQAARFEEERRGWENEKTALIEELSRWEKRHQEQVARVLELEKGLAESEESARRALGVAQSMRMRLQEREAAWEKDRREILSALSEAERKCQEQTPRILELEKRLAEAEESGRRASEALTLECEARSQGQKRHQEIVSHYEEQLKAAQAHARQAEETFSRREQEFSARERELLDRQEEKAKEHLAAINQLEKRSIEEGESAHQAQALAQNRRLRLEERETAWEKERASLLAELAERDRRAQEQLARVLELEKRLAQAEEGGKRVSEALALECEARQQAEKREQAFIVRYEAEFKALNEQALARENVLAAQHANQVRTLEERERELLKRFEEARASWEKERQALLNPPPKG